MKLKRIATQFMMFFVLLSSSTTYAAEVWYEDLSAASDACNYVQLKDNPENRTLRTNIFGNIIGSEESKAKETLGKAYKMILQKAPERQKFADYISCMSQKLAANTSNQFKNQRFFGLDFRSEQKQLDSLGVKFKTEKTIDTFGKGTLVDKLNSEPKNTLERIIHYKEGYGLYRARISLGAPGQHYLSPDETYLRWNDIVKKLTLAGARTITSQGFETFDNYSTADLRSCKGDPKINEIFSRASGDELKDFVMGPKNSVKESQFIGIFCGMMKEPRFEFTFDGWDDGKMIIVAVIVQDISSGTVNMVLLDHNIANFVIEERK